MLEQEYKKPVIKEIYKITPSVDIKKLQEKFIDLDHVMKEQSSPHDITIMKSIISNRLVYDYLINPLEVKEIFSQLLSDYPQLGGRFKRFLGKKILNDFTDPSFELAFIESTDPFPSNPLDYRNYIHKIPLEIPLTLDSPIFGLTLTHFPKENKTLLVTEVNHGLCDGSGFHTIMSHLANLLKSKERKEINPYLGLRRKFLYPGMQEINTKFPIPHHMILAEGFKAPHLLGNPKMLIYDFPYKNVLETSVKYDNKYSVNDIISGVLLKASAASNKKAKNIQLMYMVNSRKYLNIPKDFIGNCYHANTFKMNKEEIISDPLDILIEKYKRNHQENIKERSENYVKYINNLWHSMEPEMTELVNFPMCENLTENLITSNTMNFHLGNLDFGKGGPVEFQKPLPTSGRLSMFHLKDKDTISFKVPLPKDEYNIFIESLNHHFGS